MRIIRAHTPLLVIIAVTFIAGAIMIVSSPGETPLRPTPVAPTTGVVSGVADRNVATEAAFLAEPEVSERINTYLVQHVAQRSTDGITFCAHQILGSKRDGANFNVYLWILCQEYITKNSVTTKGLELSSPVVLSSELSNGTLEITGYRLPGSKFKEEVRALFPETVQKVILSSSSSQTNARTTLLQGMIDKQKDIFF